MMNKPFLIVLALFSSLICLGTAQALHQDSVLIQNIPHVFQHHDFCGEACAEMVLRKLGHKMTQNDVFGFSGLDPSLGRGCYAAELRTALHTIGFRIGPVWYNVRPTHVENDLNARFEELCRDLKRGIPSIVCMLTDAKPGSREHFRLIVGYDAGKDEIIYHEPAVEGGAYLRMERDLFLRLWPLKYSKKQWLAIRFRMDAGDLTRPAAEKGFSRADFAQHVMQLKKQVPKGFHIVVQAPFVVIGNESGVRVRERVNQTVEWAVDRLKAAYFKKDPNQIIDIWLFRDRSSYAKYCQSLFGVEPHTPYGFYLQREGGKNALIMNIASGPGTLVHEIVHPFVESNFPACPAWFNEGLGSLYEQYGDGNGHIKGFTNWRLEGLQQAITTGALPAFKSLLSTTEEAFYNQDPGTNYAQARYLCYYLQEKGLLKPFYHSFVKNQRWDPTGYKTLKKVLGVEDMASFQQRWEAYVLTLKFP